MRTDELRAYDVALTRRERGPDGEPIVEEATFTAANKRDAMALAYHLLYADDSPYQGIAVSDHPDEGEVDLTGVIEPWRDWQPSDHRRRHAPKAEEASPKGHAQLTGKPKRAARVNAKAVDN